MKLLITAGGGGHFAPALAVIEKLPKDWEVLLVGRKYAFEGDKTHSLEYQTAEKLNIPFVTLTTGRLQRKLTRYTFSSLLKTPVGFSQAFNIITKYKPDVILSFGGYVSLPVAVVGYSVGIPLVVHEQTLGAGLTNKFVAKFAKKICISWEESEKFFPKEKVVLTGNPLRSNFISSSNRRARTIKGNKPLVYITGGSGGAHGINILIESCLESLLEKYILIHQTGDAKQFNDFDRLNEKKASMPKELQERYLLTKFVDPSDVPILFEKADLVISRAGINTVTELLFLGKPCLLIPLPHGQHNEQLQNAKFVQRIGLGEVAEQHELNSEKVTRLIDQMFATIDTYRKHASEAKKLAHPHAAEKIIEVISYVQAQKASSKSQASV
jgi:UDP-N-acetylglucosamine--N-acetylmuramyl-(pentapeptide) pyrophosphoryl-undecaprenol N-acetylglucosamine transferase